MASVDELISSLPEIGHFNFNWIKQKIRSIDPGLSPRLDESEILINRVESLSFILKNETPRDIISLEDSNISLDLFKLNILRLKNIVNFFERDDRKLTVAFTCYKECLHIFEIEKLIKIKMSQPESDSEAEIGSDIEIDSVVEISLEDESDSEIVPISPYWVVLRQDINRFDSHSSGLKKIENALISGMNSLRGTVGLSEIKFVTDKVGYHTIPSREDKIL